MRNPEKTIIEIERESISLTYTMPLKWSICHRSASKLFHQSIPSDTQVQGRCTLVNMVTGHLQSNFADLNVDHDDEDRERSKAM